PPRSRAGDRPVSKRCAQVLNEALHEVFAERDDVYLLGEDERGRIEERCESRLEETIAAAEDAPAATPEAA
ncbi:MAG: hypothetical protein M3Q59_08755, partial [Actinomycetota bacterium]|nr:hypothetical protein [Actinomycetota bacterium]